MSYPSRLARRSARRACRGLALLATPLLAALLHPAGVGAGHEMPFYPGYYPQEIRIETVAPAAAASRLRKSELHAYLGADPFSGRKDPVDVRSVESFGSYLVITFNPAVPALASRESRCEGALRIARS